MPTRTLTAIATALLLILAATGCEGRDYDRATIPPQPAGTSEVRIAPATYQPIDRTAYDPTGAFRTDCGPARVTAGDPIGMPGRQNAGMSHLHQFAGNTSLWAGSTTPRSPGARSTCYGGTANLTGYWVPAMLDGDDVVPMSSIDSAMQAYYKSGYQGVVAGQVRDFPTGLKMLVGNKNSTQLDTRHIYWSCLPNDRADSSTERLGTIPKDCAGKHVQLTLEFPQCWNGKDLDSPDHRSHMSYALGWPNLGCPSTHPVALAQITEHWRWPADGDQSGWRLSSDMDDTRSDGGYSAHGDWWDGWDRDVFGAVVRNCISKGIDCQNNLLGDGRMLIAPPVDFGPVTSRLFSD